MNRAFMIAYRKWLDEALAQYNERFEPRPYHQETVPEIYEPGDLVEIAEDGTVYPHSRGGTNYIPNVATPWEESIHYIEV
mgnify:CR=1 FL=1